MRLFLDANVLFTAAHNPDGKAALVIELGAQGRWQVFSSPCAFEEARRNLQRKFPDSARMLAALGRELRLVDHRPGLESPEGLAEKDRPIFQAALNLTMGRCATLRCTGSRHTESDAEISKPGRFSDERIRDLHQQ